MTGSRPVEPPQGASPIGHAGALRVPQHWRYVSRLAPWPLIVAGIVIGSTWAARSHLNSALDVTVLAVITTLALSRFFADDADAFTGAVPTPLWARRLSMAAGPLAVVAVAWALTVAVTSGGGGRGEESPWWAMTFEWATVAASQLALGAAASRRSPASDSVLPGLLMALIWLATGVPLLHRHLHPVDAHVVIWFVLFAAAMSTVVVESRDRARR